MRPIAIIFAAAFFAIGSLIAWIIASTTIDWIEASQQAELEQAYYAGGIDWIEAEADGFLVTIRGEAASRHDLERAINIGRLIFGESLIDETTSHEATAIVTPAEIPTIEILKNNNNFLSLYFSDKNPAGIDIIP